MWFRGLCGDDHGWGGGVGGEGRRRVRGGCETGFFTRGHLLRRCCRNPRVEALELKMKLKMFDNIGELVQYAGKAESVFGNIFE